jgi:hypothetical protein
MNENEKEKAEKKLKKLKKEFDELMAKYPGVEILAYADGGGELWVYDEITCVEVFLR